MEGTLPLKTCAYSTMCMQGYIYMGIMGTKALCEPSTVENVCLYTPRGAQDNPRISQRPFAGHWPTSLTHVIFVKLGVIRGY